MGSHSQALGESLSLCPWPLILCACWETSFPPSPPGPDPLPELPAFPDCPWLFARSLHGAPLEPHPWFLEQCWVPRGQALPKVAYIHSTRPISLPTSTQSPMFFLVKPL